VSGTVAFRALDPARARGAVLVAVASVADGCKLETFRSSGKDGREVTAAVSDVILGSPAAIDERGIVYMAMQGTPRIAAFRDGAQLWELALSEPLEAMAVSHDGASLAMVTANAVSVTDVHGAVRWRHSRWSPQSAAFTTDDRRVLVKSLGGLELLDATSGRVVALGCGWRFGLHDLPLVLDATQAPSLCEDRP
jgi:hypothetical protein